MERPPLQEHTTKQHVQLNEDLVQELQRSYAECTEIEVWTEGDPSINQVVKDLIREGGIYARRTRTSFRYRFGSRDGKNYVAFKLAPRRVYTRRPKEN